MSDTTTPVRAPSLSARRTRRAHRQARRVLAAVAVLVLVWTLVYEVALRERLATWGATSAEAAAAMPGYVVVPDPHSQTTRAVDTTASPEEVWPWIAQYGVGRGGLYNYDWIETLIGMPVHSATRVDPSLPQLRVGDRIRYTPEGYVLEMEYEVVKIAPPHLLVLATPTDADVPATSITWRIAAHGDRSRILLRWRSASGGGLSDFINHVVAPAAWVMERKELLTIAANAAAGAEEGDRS